MDHDWVTEEVSCSIDTSDYWLCRRYGASGGPVGYDSWPLGKLDAAAKPPSMRPFYSDGSGLRLTMDCVESASLIGAHFQRIVQRAVAEGFNRELAAKFECAVSTVGRWASGVAQPLPRLRREIIDEVRRIFDGQLPR